MLRFRDLPRDCNGGLNLPSQRARPGRAGIGPFEVPLVFVFKMLVLALRLVLAAYPPSFA